jgi:hypothetical protein
VYPAKGRSTVIDRVRAELRQSGGFAGRTVHVRADSTQLPPVDAAELVRLVGSIDLDGLPTGSAPPAGGADLMAYDLTIERGSHRWNGRFSDPRVPAQLRPLLQFLTAHARPGAGW